MKNDLFSIGPLTVHSYGLMIALGILVCVFMGMYRARKYGYKDEAVLDIAIFGILSGFVGAKLLYVLVEFDSFLKNPMDVLGSEGFVVYGGIIVGALVGILYCRIKKLPCWEYFDLLAPSIAVAQGFGRNKLCRDKRNTCRCKTSFRKCYTPKGICWSAITATCKKTANSSKSLHSLFLQREISSLQVFYLYTASIIKKPEMLVFSICCFTELADFL